MIDIRKAKGAKKGLHELSKYVVQNFEHRITQMVEIGSFAGISTSIFLNYFGVIYCIDPWDAEVDKDGLDEKYGMSTAEKQFNEQVFEPNKQRIVKIKSLSNDTVDYFEDSTLDFVYIDGDHSYEGVKQDIINWFPKVKVGGYIGGHDYDNPPHPGVKKAVDELLIIEKRFEDTSWIAQKK